jgi:hypothetical protein
MIRQDCLGRNDERYNLFTRVDFWAVIGQSCAMTRVASLLLLTALLFSRTAPAVDRTLMAEGDCVAQKDPNKPLAHWKLWHLRNGEYEVVETLAGIANIVQVFRFDAQFLPSGFSLRIDWLSKVPAAQRDAPFTYHPTTISCRYGAQDLSCETDNTGKKSAASIPAKRPYLFVPGEFYALDYLWLMTGIVRLTEHNDAEGNAVNMYEMVDNKIHSGHPIQVTLTGRRTAIVMGKAQPVTEYEVWMGGKPGEWVLSELSVLQVTSQGLVASVRGKSHPGLGFAITNYKEYEPWLAGGQL